ncbi:hypothetical protein DFH09DRAFT_1331340 [Mycena vulgaris]|nr:hypothetical protein DFH09DRAFT_1331340 [Mycena vulgaris]
MTLAHLQRTGVAGFAAALRATWSAPLCNRIPLGRPPFPEKNLALLVDAFALRPLPPAPTRVSCSSTTGPSAASCRECILLPPFPSPSATLRLDSIHSHLRALRVCSILFYLPPPFFTLRRSAYVERCNNDASIPFYPSPSTPAPLPLYPLAPRPSPRCSIRYSIVFDAIDSSHCPIPTIPCPRWRRYSAPLHSVLLCPPPAPLFSLAHAPTSPHSQSPSITETLGQATLQGMASVLPVEGLYVR